MTKETQTDELKEWICEMRPFPSGRKLNPIKSFTQRVFAKDPAEAEQKLAGWNERGFSVHCLHLLSDIQKQHAADKAHALIMQRMKEENDKRPAATVEVENV